MEDDADSSTCCTLPCGAVAPGDRICSEREFIGGRGTYTAKGSVYSSVVGFVSSRSLVLPNNGVVNDESEEGDKAETDSGACPTESNKSSLIKGLRMIVEVLGVQMMTDFANATSAASCSDESLLPSVGTEVWGRVTRVSSKSVSVDILLSEPSGDVRVFAEPFKGQIRIHDIRNFEVDCVKPSECFKSGDIIKAKVISTGDSRGEFLLSTADVSYGVVYATDSSGGSQTLEPVSARFMLDRATGLLQPRKVAFQSQEAVPNKA